MALLGQFNELFNKLSARERGLAGLVALALAVAVCFTVVKSATSHLNLLERQITTKQGLIVKYNHQIARRQNIDTQYARIAAQHSSGWTEAEVMDRLRQEIYRLAKKVPPALNEDGIPFSTATPHGDLVKIPELRQGSVTDSGEGYFEYRMSLRIPRANIMRVVEFIERLQSSPQSLRIEGLAISREPLSTNVRCDIDIARVLAVGSIEGGDIVEMRPPTSTTPPAALNSEDWSCEGCKIEQVADATLGGGSSLRVEAASEAAELSMTRSLPAGTTYDLLLDARIFNTTTIAICNTGENQDLAGAQTLDASDTAKRYHLQFTVPGAPGTQTDMSVPLFQLASPGNAVQVDAVRLVKVGV
jgi:hypothetical protein